MDAPPNMAAPLPSKISTPLSKYMSTKVFSQSAKKQKKKAAKLLLGGFEGPQPQWPLIPKETQSKILTILSNGRQTKGTRLLSKVTQVFAVIGWKRAPLEETIFFLIERNFKMLSTKEKTFLKRDDLEGDDETKAKKLRTNQESASTLRPELVFGINEVTRGLEKDRLCLVVADRSVKPFSMISHLVGLAASRKCPAIAVEDLAVEFGKEIGVTSLVAFGIKRVSPSCRTLITDILSLLSLPPPDLYRPPEPPSKSAQLGTQVNEQLTIGENQEMPKELEPAVPAASPTYKPLMIKSQFKDPERSQKLAKRQKKPPAVERVPLMNTRKRKAKTVKIGKKHRKSLTTS